MNTDYFRYCPKCGARALQLRLPGMIKFGRVGSAYHRRDGVLSGGQVTGGEAVLFKVMLVVLLGTVEL
jgi:hypothetical protein